MDHLQFDRNKLRKFLNTVSKHSSPSSAEEWDQIQQHFIKHNILEDDKPKQEENLKTPVKGKKSLNKSTYIKGDSSISESDKLTQISANKSRYSSNKSFEYGFAVQTQNILDSHEYYQEQTSNRSHKSLTTFQQYHNQQARRNRRQCFDIEISRTCKIIEDGRTTLMIKNIPNKFDQTTLLQAINQTHDKQYDFFYLPIDFINKCNVGYAFINFTDLKFIEPFVSQFQGKKWNLSNSEKVCQITYARIQGRHSLIKHFQNSILMNEKDCRVVPLFRTDKMISIQELVQRQKQQDSKKS